MSKRIRYTKTRNDDEVRSIRNFVGQQGGKYQVKINTKENTYRIINITSHLIMRSTEKDGCKPPKNLYTVHEQVKRALKTLGVKFKYECRNLED